MTTKKTFNSLNNPNMMSHPATPGQNPGHQPNYSWTGVMEFLQEQLHNAKKRENDWIADKKALEVSSSPFL